MTDKNEPIFTYYKSKTGQHLKVETNEGSSNVIKYTCKAGNFRVLNEKNRHTLKESQNILTHHIEIRKILWWDKELSTDLTKINITMLKEPERRFSPNVLADIKAKEKSPDAPTKLILKSNTSFVNSIQVNDAEEVKPKKRGRKPGSKNKKVIEPKVKFVAQVDTGKEFKVAGNIIQDGDKSLNAIKATLDNISNKQKAKVLPGIPFNFEVETVQNGFILKPIKKPNRHSMGEVLEPTREETLIFSKEELLVYLSVKLKTLQEL